MKCPNDAATLVMSERSGIEIDYCPECRGVWLDRGELDKIIERSSPNHSQSAPDNFARQAEDHPYQATDAPSRIEKSDRYTSDGDKYHHNTHSDPRYHKRHKKESFLSDLFDF